jgi:opacity protein-like surface antigen
MKARRSFLFVSVALFFAAPAHAQGFYWSLAWEPSVPIGSVGTASTPVTAAGASLGARYLFTRHWSLGIGGHWNQFARNYPRATYPINNGAITGAIFREVWLGSVLGEAHLYLAPTETLSPYLGLGAGYSLMSSKIVVTDISIDDRTPGFAVSPEAGVLIAFDRDPYEPQQTAMQSLMLGARYEYSTAGSRDISNVSFFALTLGAFIY